MKPMAAEIAALREMPVAELIPRYRDLFGREPRCKNRAWLWRRCAWKLQEQRCGGLSEVAKRTLEDLISQIELPAGDRDRTVSGKIARPQRPDDPMPGTTIVRPWKGRELHLHVREDGFELDGVLHRSLTAAALAATGSRWSGRLFWQLKDRKKQS